MSTTSQKRREKRHQNKSLRLSKRRNRDRQILKGLLDDWKLSGFEGELAVTEYLLRNRESVPLIELENPGNATGNQVLQKMWHLMKSEPMQVPGLNRCYTPFEFFSIVKPAISFLKANHQCGQCKAARRLAREAEQRAKELGDARTEDLFVQMFIERVREILICYSRMTDSLYSIRTQKSSGSGSRTQTAWRISETKATHVRLQFDGETRSALRCGQVNEFCGLDGNDGIEWVVWDSAHLNLEGPQRRLPVYVQPHVFERVYGEEGRLKCLAHCQESLLHDWIYEGLRDPRVHLHRRDPGSLLIEYGPIDCKLGYLVCQVLAEAVVARTFLFLTMDGTPEGDKLYARLRVNRYDKSHLGLDSLDTLRMTDFCSDPVLRRIFDECGLRHIFEELDFEGVLKTGYAGSCRSYLGGRRLG